MLSCFVDPQDAAAAAIFLAAKVEEFRVHIKDVMMATYRVRHKGERRLVENSDVRGYMWHDLTFYCCGIF